MTLDYTGRQLRHAMTDGLLDQWGRPVRDTQPGHPGDVEIIGQYYREVGGWWTTYLDKYGDGAYVEVYVVDGERRYMSWCGIVIGWAGIHVGDYLESDVCVPVEIHPVIAAELLPSTYRLTKNEQWRAVSEVPRQPAPKDIERGDIVVVGHDKHYGDHITMSLGTPAGGEIETVSGNVSNALLGDGETGEGIGKKTYELGDISRVYRLGRPHFITPDDLRTGKAAA